MDNRSTLEQANVNDDGSQVSKSVIIEEKLSHFQAPA